MHKGRKETIQTAGECGLRGDGRDETKAFQRALDRLARQGKSCLRLDAGAVYRVTGLRARRGVTIAGQGAVLTDPQSPLAAGRYLFSVAGDQALECRDIILRADCAVRASGKAQVTLTDCTLEPAHEAMRLHFSQSAVLRARRVTALHGIAPEYPVLFEGDARVDWRGGALRVHGMAFFDRAGGRLDLDRLLGAPGERSQVLLGRIPGNVSWPLSDPHWAALCGTPEQCKQVLGNPRHARALARWRKCNATQCGRLTLHARTPAHEARTAGVNVLLHGCYRLEVRATHLVAARSCDETRLRMRGGSLVRIEASGSSVSRYRDVRLVAPGRDDPWHPKTSYLQGFHNMEFGRFYNDIVPRVEFRDGVIDFAGDDCLNGLPEPRAMQLMEIVHAFDTLFPALARLEAFRPEERTPGRRLTDLTGAAGALHDEDTNPRRPFDFRDSGFTWRGEYVPAATYRPGDVCAFRGLLYVCNRVSRGREPNAVFDRWQVFTVAFRNAAGYIQAARRVRGHRGWIWELRQALGPWAGYTKRERGNPIVTYHVHLILKNVEVIRRANTWSFCCSPAVPVGNAAYDYLLSTHVPNVPYNTEVNRVECYDVTLTNLGTDAMPVRGLCLGPHRLRPGRSVFQRVRIRGESIGAPLLFRVDSEPLKPGQRVVLREVAGPGTLRAVQEGVPHPFDGDERFASMQRIAPHDTFGWYDFLDHPPPDWKGVTDYLRRFIHIRASAAFLENHPGWI